MTADRRAFHGKCRGPPAKRGGLARTGSGLQARLPWVPKPRPQTEKKRKPQPGIKGRELTTIRTPHPSQQAQSIFLIDISEDHR